MTSLRMKQYYVCMNYDLHEKDLFELLTSHPWDNGIGKKMLFLKRRYYVFDDEHQLIDGGVINYNKTLEKIFIRNEDLKGEVFLSLAAEDTLHLHGAVFSKLAGQIIIDNLLHKYEKDLQAPLSRVAKVEKYLTSNDIYKTLLSQDEIDDYFLRSFEKSLHAFSNQQARDLYIKLSPKYFQNFEIKVLKTISLYFSTSPVNDKLYEELFMFLLAIQAAYKNNYIKTYDINFFISCVKDRLLQSYENRPSSISINLINECLLYYKLDSPALPTPKDCIQKLYDKNLHLQEEYAYYLSLMEDKAKEVEEDIYERLVAFYREKFFTFKEKLSGSKPHEHKIKKVVTELNTQLALIQALGNCKSDNKDVHILLLFLLSNNEDRVKSYAKKAFINCKEKAIKTFKTLHLEESISKIMDEG